MVKKNEGKGGGAKLTKTEIVTVRVDPKIKYLAELAARRQRRSLSSFIEWAILESLDVMNSSGRTEEVNIDNSLWDIDEADRFILLATECNELLN